MSEQLLPCPFCGSTDHLDMKDARDFITCLDCGTEGPYQPGRAVEAWNSRADHIGEANKKVGQDCAPVLVRDLAEILGRAVPDVMSAFIVAGLAPHSPNMAVSGEDALAVAAVLKTQRQDCEPIYQWRMNDGQWLDQTRSLYYSRVDAGEEKSRLRIVYAAPPVAQDCEPVAWLKRHRDGSIELNEYRTFLPDDAIATGRTPLYAATPKREPLTPAQRDSVCLAADKRMSTDQNLSWRQALITETEFAHGIWGQS